MNHGSRTILYVIIITGIALSAFVAQGSFNPQINYQGKLTNSADVAAESGNWNVEFKLYATTTGGAAIWTETCTTTSRISIVNGLFSHLLGSVNPLTGVSFDQELWLGVNIGGTSTSPSWDGEMTPRKKLGAVPAAFEADKLDGIDSSEFLRSNADDTATGTITFAGSINLNATTTVSASSSLYFAGGTTYYVNNSGNAVFNTLNAATTTFSKLLTVSAGGANITGGLTTDTLIATTSTLGTVISGIWNGTAIGTNYGGTGLNTSGWSGLVKVTGGTWATTTDNTTNWDTAYADRLKWDGGSSGLVTSTARTSLGLNNVENTALSTWAGSVNLTTLGTIATGTWNATSILNAKIASSTEYLADIYWNGTSTNLVTSTARTSLGLGAMALNPAAGSTTITTLGAIGTGSWAADSILNAYIASSTEYLADNNTIYTAGDFLTLTGTDFDVDATSTITNGDTSYLANADVIYDFVTGRGYLTTVDISSNTNLATSTGITLTNDTLGWSSTGLTWAGNAISNAYIASSTEYLLDTNTDIYWTGTSTNLVAATGRTSLGLGSMALLLDSGSTSITTLGTIGTGTWNADSILNAKIASSTEYLADIYWTGTATNLVAATGRSSLGLGDMALNPAAGSTTITTLGTIGTGTWNASLIGTQYGGTGQNWSSVAAGSIPYFSGTGVMTASTSPLYIDSVNGNVGIGTTSPSTKLEIYGTSGTSSTIRINNISTGLTDISQTMSGIELLAGAMSTSAKYTSALKFGSTDPSLTTTNPKFLAGIVGRATESYNADTDSGMALDFLTTDDNAGATSTPSAVMTILGNGNVGIGTTTIGSRLTIQSSGTASTTSALNIKNSAGTSMLYVGDDGNVGIGGISPLTRLQVAVPANSESMTLGTASGGFSLLNSANSYGLFGGVGDSGNAWLQVTTNYGNAVAYNLVLQPNGGNVGIGTITPAYKLDVDGDMNLAAGSVYKIGGVTQSGSSKWTAGTGDNIYKVSGNVAIGTTTSGSILTIQGTSSTALLNVTASSSASALYVDNKGYVGIGKTPGVVLDVTGGTTANHLRIGGSARALTFSTEAYDGSDDALHRLSIASVSGTFAFNNSNGELVRIASTGNVGIGTTTINARLTIQSTSTTDILNLFETGGTEVFTVLESGNVGIGTASPQSKLNLDDAIDSLALTLSQRASWDTTKVASIEFKYSNTLYSAGKIVATKEGIYQNSSSTSADSGLAFYTANDSVDYERMKIDENGNVGIGATDPSTKLVVEGVSSSSTNRLIFLENSYAATSTWDTSTSIGFGYLSSSENSSSRIVGYTNPYQSRQSRLQLQTHSSADGVFNVGIMIDENGNVGIGTTTPAAKLDIDNIQSTTGTFYGVRAISSSGTGNTINLYGVYGKSTGTDDTSYGVYGEALNGSSGGVTYGGYFTGSGGATNYGVYSAAGTNYFSGNVGIGTTSPAYTLDVRGSATSTYVAQIYNTNTATSADGLLINLGIANASRNGGNYFIGFAGAGTVGGKIQGTSSSAVAYVTSGADYAEYFLTGDPINIPTGGELVAIDGQVPGAVRKATSSQDNLIGVVSISPGFVGGGSVCPIESQDQCDADYVKNNVLVSLVGQTPVRVSLENGPITTGDPITASSKPGVGMKATESCRIIGYALENFAENDADGMIKAFINPGWHIVLDELGMVKGGEENSQFLISPPEADQPGADNLDSISNEGGDEASWIASLVKVIKSSWNLIVGRIEAIFVKANKVETGELVITGDTLQPGSGQADTHRSSTIGSGEITEASQEVKIYNTNIKQNSKIFVSFTSDLGGRSWYISEKHAIPGDDEANNYFTVRLSTPAEEDTLFDYWIIQTTSGYAEPTPQDNADNTPGDSSPAPEQSSVQGQNDPSASSGQATPENNISEESAIPNGGESASSADSTLQQSSGQASSPQADLIDQAIEILDQGQQEQQIIDNLKQELQATSTTE